jgi:DNA-binding transcriptional ArsR family regulator
LRLVNEFAFTYHQAMKEGPHIARIAALIADNARAEVLSALMADRALTATELAAVANVTKQTMSAHLAKLVDAGLLSVEQQGRHRYFQLSSRDVASALESLMNVAFRTGAVRMRASPREPTLRKARVCYDHMAGELGVETFERMVESGILISCNGELRLTKHGRDRFIQLGIDVAAAESSKRHFCRTCMDWSERRHHLAGALGSELLKRILAQGWATRVAESRALVFSANGERALRQSFTSKVQ